MNPGPITATPLGTTLLMWDQMTNFWPPHVWTPEHAPLAAVFPDLDSSADAGCTYVSIYDVLPICRAPADAQGAIARSIDVRARIKQNAMAVA